MSTNPAASSSPLAPIESGCEPGSSGGSVAGAENGLGALERRLLDEFQRDFPLSPRPFQDIGTALGVSESRILECLESLRARGYVSRVGPVFAPHRVGYSVLAALAVPGTDVERVADLVSAHPEVNHNYEREHAYNLWFVTTGEGPEHVERVIRDIEAASGLEALRLPLERPYHIDLGFPLWR
jgi:DNA-binding Lrp family transcriptional regulator